MNVRFLLYEPERSGSLAPIDWRSPIWTPSFVTGPVQLRIATGVPVVVGISTYAGFGTAGDGARSASGVASENEPLTRRPGAFVLLSATLSAALPAVLVTCAPRFRS